MNTHSTALIIQHTAEHAHSRVHARRAFLWDLSNLGCQYILRIAVSPLAIGYIHIRSQYWLRSERSIYTISFILSHTAAAGAAAASAHSTVPINHGCSKWPTDEPNHHIVHDFNVCTEKLQFQISATHFENEKQCDRMCGIACLHSQLKSHAHTDIFGWTNFRNELILRHLFELQLKCDIRLTCTA